MKKILIIILTIFLVGCNNTPKESKSELEKEDYINYVKKLEKINEPTDDIPFDIEVKYDKLTKDEVRYQIVIDNPKYELNDVKALAIHNKETDDIFPSSGIFENPIDLIPNQKPEGIILVGYIPYTKKVDDFKCNIKVLVEYKIDNKKYTSYYVTKK